MSGFGHPRAQGSAGLAQAGPDSKPARSDVVRRLARELADQDIAYCEWRQVEAGGPSSADESIALRFLVGRADRHSFSAVLARLGFKASRPAADEPAPGCAEYHAHDEEVERLVHVRADCELIVGRGMAGTHRVPIEKPCLESGIPGDPFRRLAPEHELILRVISLALEPSLWESLFRSGAAASRVDGSGLLPLQVKIDEGRLGEIVDRHLPYIGSPLFEDCLRALGPTSSPWQRWRTGRQLRTRLEANACRPRRASLARRIPRIAFPPNGRGARGTRTKRRLENGGALIAIVGGDGAGKSTVVEGLHAWLAGDFATARFHLGKPPWSWITTAVRVVLKLGQLAGLYRAESTFRETVYEESPLSPGYPYLLREVCRARDRYRTYCNARRFAGNGGLVILDRFPVPQIELMDGPLAARFLSRLWGLPQARQLLTPRPESRLARALVKLEESYYQRVVPPEVLVVLRVDPEIAVERRTGEEPTAVRERSTEIWNLSWERTGAHVIDASKPKAEVLREVKARVWSEL